MKASKIILPLVMVAVLGVSWYSFVTGTIDTKKEYNDCMEDAKISIEDGLYEQAIEFYKEALDYELSEDTYKKIKETYDLLYEEEHTAFIRNLYLEDMAVASGDFPENGEFWLTQVNLYMDAENYSKAYSTAKQAKNYGVDNEKLNDIYKTLLYMVKIDYKLYYDYKTALNGYITVYDGNKWKVLDETGDSVSSTYNFIGLINDDGKGLYINDIDTRILDSKEITRARFDFDVEDAGYYNEGSDLMPVKIDGLWKYMNMDGEFLPGEYEIAGSFYNHKAVAYTGKKWVQIDEEGNQTSLDKFEDIKLDLYGAHIQGDVIIAKENGKYHFYDTEFNKIGNFEADDIDICVGGSLVAFKQNDKWGFVDTEGNVKVEPEYANARSFSNGYAAVCNDKGLWGFINSEYKVVIDYSYIDALYFNSSETCLVSTTENTVQLLHFMFE